MWNNLIDERRHAGVLSRTRARWGSRAGLVALLLWVASAGHTQTASEYQVKAAYLYNFAKSAEWPEGTLRGTSPMVIGVVGGDDEFIDTLARTVAGRTVDSHPFLVKRAGTTTEMDFCNLIFFRSSVGHKRTESAVAALNAASILLVGEDPDFLRQGGMINLELKNGKIRFEIEKTSLNQANIRLSPELLALASAEPGSSGRAAASNNSAPAASPAGSGVMSNAYSTGAASPASNPVPAGPTPSNLVVSGQVVSSQSGSGPSGETRRLRVGSQPEYPIIAQRMSLKGVVQLEITVARDGSVKDVRVVGGHPVLTEAAVKAVKAWRYEPAARESQITVKFVFGD